jgi:glycerophosphoryl diester phosphodiesterase
VRQLKDDQLVVIHDDDFVRTTGKSHHVESCNLLKLSNLIIAINGRRGDLKNTHLACPM